MHTWDGTSPEATIKKHPIHLRLTPTASFLPAGVGENTKLVIVDTDEHGGKEITEIKQFAEHEKHYHVVAPGEERVPDPS